MTDQYGATSDDWTMLSVVAGLTEDLLPVVSNPGARIDPDSKLKTLGKVPSIYNTAGMVVGLGKWTEKRTTVRDVERWAAVPDLGICLQTRSVRALDIDIEHRETVDEILWIVSQHIGELPLRYRTDSTKCLAAFVLPGEYTKRILTTKHGAIEFLATGQQFIAAGTHPKGARYEWVGGMPMDFPEITSAKFEALWAELSHTFGTAEVIEYGAGRNVKEIRRAVDVNDDVVDYLHANDWVKSENGDGRLNIRCPFEAQHSGPSADDTATQYMPKGVGGFEQGHFNCLHAHCAKRNDGDFLEAIGVVAEQFDVVEITEAEAAAEPPPFARQPQTGKILSTIGNLMLALRNPEWAGVEVARDEFRDELMITPVGRRKWRSFSDPDYTRVRLQLAGKGLDISLELVKEAISLQGDDNRFDSAILWLTEEVPAWDGVPRIDGFYPGYFGTEDSAYTRAVGAYTWTAMAARVLDPGHKVDMVPILCSGEGCRKSESIATMVPSRDFFVELDLSAKDDDMSRLMRGRLVAELGEMRGLRQREMGALKSFITRRYEHWVPKYKEFAVQFPRRLLFIGTTNESEFLSDQTGRRRWLPMNISQADTDAITRDRTQLWAEARDRFKASGVAFENAEDLAREEHQKFEESHPWEDAISNWLDQTADFESSLLNRQMPFTTEHLLAGAINIPISDFGRKAHANAVGAILRKFGFVMSEAQVAGKRKRVWREVNPHN